MHRNKSEKKWRLWSNLLCQVAGEQESEGEQKVYQLIIWQLDLSRVKEIWRDWWRRVLPINRIQSGRRRRRGHQVRSHTRQYEQSTVCKLIPSCQQQILSAAIYGSQSLLLLLFHFIPLLVLKLLPYIVRHFQYRTDKLMAVQRACISENACGVQTNSNFST